MFDDILNRKRHIMCYLDGALEVEGDDYMTDEECIRLISDANKLPYVYHHELELTWDKIIVRTSYKEEVMRAETSR